MICRFYTVYRLCYVFRLHDLLRCFASCACARSTTRLNASISNSNDFWYVKHNRVCSYRRIKNRFLIQGLPDFAAESNVKSEIGSVTLVADEGMVSAVLRDIFIGTLCFHKLHAQSFDSNFVGKPTCGIPSEYLIDENITEMLNKSDGQQKSWCDLWFNSLFCFEVQSNIRSNCLKWGILKAFSSTKPVVAFGHVLKHQRTGVLSHNVNKYYGLSMGLEIYIILKASSSTKSVVSFG